MSSLDDLEDLFEDLSIDGPDKIQMFTMYGHYLKGIVNNPLVIKGITLTYNSNPSKHPVCRGKHQCFEHIITRASKHSGKEILTGKEPIKYIGLDQFLKM